MKNESVHWVTVFDLAQSGYKDWWFPALGLIFVALGAFMTFAPRALIERVPNFSRVPNKVLRPLGVFFSAFAVLWTIIAFVATFGEYQRLRWALDHGRYRVVEGYVENLHPMPLGKFPSRPLLRFLQEKAESFDVKGVHFEYSNFTGTSAFNDMVSHGGPMRNGLYIRIAYTEGKIVRLQIRK